MSRSLFRASTRLTRIAELASSNVRTLLRRAIPFALRRRLSNLRQRGAKELPVTSTHFSRSDSYDLIWFPVIPWDYLFQRPQQLATQFARAGHRVFYLRTTFHESGERAFVRTVAERIFEVRLPGSRRLNALYDYKLTGAEVGGALRALDQLRSQAGIDRAVCIVQFPNWSELAMAVKARWGWNIIYDCIDEHSGFIRNGPFVIEREHNLIASADLVSTTSRILYDKVVGRATRMLLLPNAADFDHFNSAAGPGPLSHLPRPIIGYYGAVSRWFDIDMIAAAAAARPAWQFVIIGDAFDVDLAPLARLRNVHLIARQEYGDLPRYLTDFDVACIPFLITALTEATNPVKFYEYLSAGKPVVAVDLPELRPYCGLYYPVLSKSDFVIQIETALREESAEKQELRIEAARSNQWAQRYRELDMAITKI